VFNDFRQIATPNETGKSEKLFRAAISAFCSITRPTRREASQLEDLVLPLFESVSADSLRYVAAALSECDFAPHGLVRRLAEEPVDISAPLLVRSNVLTDVDLISLIGRHGIPHARAVARRQELNPTIDDLIRALFESAARSAIESDAPRIPHLTVSSGPIRTVAPQPLAAASANVATLEPAPVIEPPVPSPLVEEQVEPESLAIAPVRRTFGKADLVRDQLRAMMRPSGPAEEEEIDEEMTPAISLPPLLTPVALSRLRDTALTGNAVFFHTALADALGLDFAAARAIGTSSGYADLVFALKSLEVTDDTAFVITAAARPALFVHAESVRLFLERYRLCHPDAARERVRGWKAESIAATVRRAKPRPAAAPVGANSDDIADDAVRILRAS
jgi:uncharacterized protein (DUF2336 family)